VRIPSPLREEQNKLLFFISECASPRPFEKNKLLFIHQLIGMDAATTATPDAMAAATTPPVAKQWRYREDAVFTDSLIVRTMVELVESKRTSMCNLNQLIIEYYHSNLMNISLNPRPPLPR
jgi:hypothetical protein